MRIVAAVLILIVAMPSLLPAQAPICKDTDLESFRPKSGAVSSRSWIDSPTALTLEDVELDRIKVHCAKKETEQACVDRAETKARKSHPGKILAAELNGHQIGINARLIIVQPSGARESIERDFASQAQLLDFVDARTDKGAQVHLLQTTPRYDQAKRMVEVRVIDGRERMVSCRPDESDAACKKRWTAHAQKGIAKSTARVEVELQGKLGGYVSQLEIDGALTTMMFASSQAAARFLQARQAEGSQVKLLSMEALLDPKTRKAKLMIVRTRQIKAIAEKWLRLIWTPEGNLMQAIGNLNEQAATSGFQIMRLEPQPEDKYLLELRCPKT
jgi:hypothetical protein